METGDWGDPVTLNVDRVSFSGNLLREEKYVYMKTR